MPVRGKENGILTHGFRHNRTALYEYRKNSNMPETVTQQSAYVRVKAVKPNLKLIDCLIYR
jgi:hypothetical protein